jgi:hypothetical protein
MPSFPSPFQWWLARAAELDTIEQSARKIRETRFIDTGMVRIRTVLAKPILPGTRRELVSSRHHTPLISLSGWFSVTYYFLRDDDEIVWAKAWRKPRDLSRYDLRLTKLVTKKAFLKLMPLRTIEHISFALVFESMYS